MVVLALVLLILVLLFGVAIVVSNPDVYQLSLFRVLVPVTSAGVFFTGFGAALVTIVALLLLRSGIRRSRENRRRLQAAERPATSSAAAAGAGSGERSSGSSPAPSTLDLAPYPGEDSTTVAADRRAAGREAGDRDEPRT
jgi:predicted lipid-binding transport protein (Tim44 family)